MDKGIFNYLDIAIYLVDGNDIVVGRFIAICVGKSMVGKKISL